MKSTTRFPQSGRITQVEADQEGFLSILILLGEIVIIDVMGL